MAAGNQRKIGEDVAYCLSKAKMDFKAFCRRFPMRMPVVGMEDAK